MTDQKYRRLVKNEVIEQGDESDASVDGWKDDPKWAPVHPDMIGERVPDPAYPSHRQYRRPCAPANDGKKTTYKVIVGNIGTVCDTDSFAEATGEYEEYVRFSKEGIGRSSGESVTLFEDGEVVREHEGISHEEV